jgi:hypothetical protein
MERMTLRDGSEGGLQGYEVLRTGGPSSVAGGDINGVKPLSSVTAVSLIYNEIKVKDSPLPQHLKPSCGKLSTHIYVRSETDSVRDR